jgi:hypothetical protein
MDHWITNDEQFFFLIWGTENELKKKEAKV